MCVNIGPLLTALDFQRSRPVHHLFAPAFQYPPFRGPSHRCGGLYLLSHHYDRCARSGSVSVPRSQVLKFRDHSTNV
jgi:hypothetical protein